ncbi:MAG TPA: DUF3617 family protein [Pseudomonadales bacterium]
MAEGSKLILASVAAAILVFAGSTAANADRPLPGSYEITTATTYHDVPLPDTTLTTTSCLTAEDLARDPAGALASLPDGQTCSVEESLMAGGVIDMRVTCGAADGRMAMVTSGTYDPNGWDMVSDVTVTVGSEEVKMHATIQGRRLGDC